MAALLGRGLKEPSVKAFVRLCCAALFVLGAAVGAVRGEVFVLTNGGRLLGELLNADESPRQSYAIRTADGVEITLDPAQVKEVHRTRPELLEYEKIEPRYADTVEGQWALAQWCAEHGLRLQREKHLRRIIELDPEYADARHALGYAKYGNKWKTVAEEKTERGMILDHGRWILPQEKRLQDEKKDSEGAERAWIVKLRHMLAEAANDPAAADNLGTIEDPVATRAVSETLAREPREEVRILLIHSLGRIGTPTALRTLAACAIDDEVAEVRRACIDELRRHPGASASDYFVGRLRDKNNLIVNRAGEALKYTGGPSAISPLINALVTIHKRIVQPANQNNMNTTFSNQGGMNFRMGDRPVEVKYPVQNRAVLDALVTLTGVNFRFDKEAWKQWYGQQRREGNTNTRRDDEPAAAGPEN